MSTSPSLLPGGEWLLGDLVVTRFGYGAVQLAGPGVTGPPADHGAALAVLRDVVDLGITHINTSVAYGPRVVNDLIREALHPYPQSLHVVTNVGAVRDERGAWRPARRPDQLRRAVDDNLDTLGLDTLDLVNLRVGDVLGPVPGSLAKAFETLVGLQRRGMIRNLGLSNATADQVAEARAIAPIACVQNLYNLARRHDDDLIDRLAADDIAYVTFCPLRGFSPVQSEALSAVATRLDTTSMSVALTWLLQRSPNILVIPGTSSKAHLRENVAGARLSLSAADVAELNQIAA